MTSQGDLNIVRNGDAHRVVANGDHLSRSDMTVSPNRGREEPERGSDVLPVDTRTGRGDRAQSPSEGESGWPGVHEKGNHERGVSSLTMAADRHHAGKGCGRNLRRTMHTTNSRARADFGTGHPVTARPGNDATQQTKGKDARED